eukprot:COSAG05_NODE_364_length_10775_cov_3.222836_14_plen_97_part_00
MAVSDVGALKLAHAALGDLTTGDMRTLLGSLLTASSADKPSCFVAVRVARALVEQQQQQQKEEEEEEKEEHAAVAAVEGPAGDPVGQNGTLPIGSV